MNRKQHKYIREIMERSCLPRAERKRVRRDLEDEFASQMESGRTVEEVIERMGEPDEIAAGLFENYSDTDERPFREYKSPVNLFGLPLVHVVRSRYAAGVSPVRMVSFRGGSVGGRNMYWQQRMGMPTARGVFAFGAKAKGIFAFGNIATGFVAVGNITFGVISIGNLALGLLGLGNLCIALLAAFGNMAAGALAFANMAFGYGAAGNLAVGRYAVGNVASGSLAYSMGNVDIPAQILWAERFFTGAPDVIKGFFSFAGRFVNMLFGASEFLPQIIIFGVMLTALVVALCLVPGVLLRKVESR